MLEQALRAAISDNHVSNKVEEIMKQITLENFRDSLSHAAKLAKLQNEGAAVWQGLISSNETKEAITAELINEYSKFGIGSKEIIIKIIEDQWRNLPNKNLSKDPVVGIIIK